MSERVKLWFDTTLCMVLWFAAVTRRDPTFIGRWVLPCLVGGVIGTWILPRWSDRIHLWRWARARRNENKRRFLDSLL